MNIGIINNRYLFRYEFNGRCDGKIADYIEVITLHSTHEIITMYPYHSNERIECIDVTPSIEDELPKVKRKSQIDKFNQRYSKN